MVLFGVVTVNNVVISDARMPFGGVKKSGFGRGLSRYSMGEFVNNRSGRFYEESCSPTPSRIILTNNQTKRKI